MTGLHVDAEAARTECGDAGIEAASGSLSVRRRGFAGCLDDGLCGVLDVVE